MRQKRKSYLTVFSIVTLIAVIGLGLLWLFSGGLKTSERTGNFISAHNKINILVMGVDERSGDFGRSDTLLVATVDPHAKTIALLSVPRDTRVKIPGYGWDKINHAYAVGGQKLAQQTVENLLGINIDYHVLINFKGFQKIIDAIGGVTIDVDNRMYYQDPYDGDGLVINIQPGEQRMNGVTAMHYVRYRDEQGDIGRIQRQQKFMKALLAEVANPMVLPKLPNIIQEIGATVKTNLSSAEMINLAKIVNDAYKQGLKTDMVPGKAGTIREISYWLPDLIGLREHVAQTLGVTLDEKYAGMMRKEAVEYETSIPKEMTIVAAPKIATPPKAPQEPEKPDTKAVEKPAVAGTTTPKPPAQAKIRVEVFNASGEAEAGNKVAEILRKQGFEVVAVANITTAYKNTLVISNTTNSAVVNKLTALPFKYVLQVTKDDRKASQVSVVIGKDFITN